MFGKYFSVFKINLQDTLSYTLEIISNFLFLTFLFFIFAQLWGNIYSSKDLIHGFSFTSMILYLVGTETLMNSRSRIEKEINNSVKNGNIIYRINKPYNYVWFEFANFMGKSLPYFFIIFSVNLLIIRVIIGSFSLSLINLLLYFVSSFFALGLLFFSLFSLGVLSFWFGEINGFRWVYQKILWIFGGSLFPVDLLPDFLKGFMNFLPFKFMLYFPAKTLVGVEGNFLANFLIQLAWFIILYLVAQLLFNKGSEKLRVMGG